MTDTEYAKAIQMRVTVVNLEMNAALTTEQQSQIGQDFTTLTTEGHPTVRSTFA